MLTPLFDGAVTSYTADTVNATNNILATVLKAGAAIAIKVNDVAHTNDTVATWNLGANAVEVKVTYGTTERTYTVTVTKTV